MTFIELAIILFIFDIIHEAQMLQIVWVGFQF